MLWGAGLTVRTAAWCAMRGKGFRFLTSLGAEDQELTCALRLAGWRLWLDPGLRLKHFLPARRLRWDYFRRLQRARSAMLVAVDPYLFALHSQGLSGIERTWSYQAFRTVRNLAQNLATRPCKTARLSSPTFEGDEDVVRIETYLGRLQGLLRCRRTYSANIRAVEQARWRRPGLQ
jgi:hypothetical protein